MQQLNSIPNFQGDESPQDAEKWLLNLVDCTESLSDAAIFRRITTKFPSGSPVREWFNSLDDSFKEKWVAFEKQFRFKWIDEPQRRADKEVAWSAFTNHFLNVDQFLGYDTTSYDDLDDKIAIWVEEHIRLAKATDHDDNMLVTATLPLLPPYISAYLQAQFKPPYGSFDTYCKKICEMPIHFLDIERIRRHMSLVDRGSSMERKVDEMSEMMKQLVVMKGAGLQKPDTPPPAPLNEPAGSNKSADINTSCGGTAPELSSSVSKAELIVITQRAIDLILTFGDLGRDQVNILLSTLAVYDGLIGCQTNEQKSINARHEGYAGHYVVSSGFHLIQSYISYNKESYLTSARDAWSNDYHSIFTWVTKTEVIMPHKTTVWDGKAHHNLQMGLSGEPKMVGALFVPHSDLSTIVISPFHTVLYVMLSSYMAECTGEEKYKEFALRSAQCVKTWMLDSVISLIKNCNIDALTGKEESGAIPSCHLSGMAIEAFSVLASVTHDESWRYLAIGIANAAMCYVGWHDSNGILTVGCDKDAEVNTDARALKGLLNRGLLVAYQRNRSNEPFCNSIRSYINIQCNALLNLSRFHDSYGIDWRGPHPGLSAATYGHAQMAAIDTLVAAIGIRDS